MDNSALMERLREAYRNDKLDEATRRLIGDAHSRIGNIVEDYQTCDRENSNLRQHLLWTAQQLPADKQRELQERIRVPIAEGGVVGDTLSDSKKKDSLVRDEVINAICDYCDTLEDDKAQYHANQLREHISHWSRHPEKFIPWS